MTVEATTERVLRLLALLQRRPSWTAAELAAELDVTDRSVRRDVERLRVERADLEKTVNAGQKEVQDGRVVGLYDWCVCHYSRGGM